MKKTLIILVLLLQYVHSNGQIQSDSLFNFDWKFYKGDVEGAELVNYDDVNWVNLDLPHDWSIEDLDVAEASEDRIISGPFDSKSVGGKSSGFTVGGIGWYRKHFKLPQSDSDKIFYLNFDGVVMNSDIWINGKHIVNQPNGYFPFWVNLTEYLNFGDVENVIAIQVENEGVSSRWYSGSGIYRDVILKKSNKLHMEPWGVFVSTPKVAKIESVVAIKALIKNFHAENQDIDFKVNILDSNNTIVATKVISTQSHNKISTNIQLKLKVDSPRLWSPKHPNLYKLQCFVLQNGTVQDTYETSFGIRNIEYDSEKGMFLNGKPIILKGGAVHSNNGCLGATAYLEAEKRRVRILKECGYNAVRCAHNPPSSHFLDECDRQGLLVIDEAFDVWDNSKTPDDYHKHFKEHWKSDLEKMILRDRNHPSIFSWSIGNQIRTAKDSITIDYANKLADFTRGVDPTRTVTSNVFMPGRDWKDGPNEKWKAYDAFIGNLDIVGYSYQSAQYEQDHQRLPDRIMFSSEINPKHCFKNWMRVKDNKNVIGNFTWTAMDYMGEASSGWLGFRPAKIFPWHTAYCGDIDLCGFRKPRSYYRDILFDNGKQIAMFVHTPTPSFEGKNVSLWGWDDVKPSWTWDGFEGEPLQVDVYSAFDEVELFLNNTSLGKKIVSRDTEFKASWNVSYVSGQLMAVGYKEGVKSDSCLLKTVEAPYSVKLIAEKDNLKADKQDLCFVVVEIVDKNGNLIPYADNLIHFEVHGEGEIIAVGNGNPKSLESFQKTYRKAYEGKCLLVIKSTGVAGAVKIIAKGKGLKKGRIILLSVK